MKLSTAKRRINKTLDELIQSVIDDWYDHFKNGYIKGYTDAREGVAPMYTDAIADTPQTEEDGSYLCDYCKYSDREWYEQPCESCHNNSGYKSKDAPQTDFVEDDKCFDCEDFFTCDEHQTDCGWK